MTPYAWLLLPALLLGESNLLLTAVILPSLTYCCYRLFTRCENGAAAPVRKSLGGGRGDPRENRPTRGIVRHDSHMRKLRSDPTRNRGPCSLMWEASSVSTTPAQPHASSVLECQPQSEPRGLAALVLNIFFNWWMWQVLSRSRDSGVGLCPQSNLCGTAEMPLLQTARVTAAAKEVINSPCYYKLHGNGAIVSSLTAPRNTLATTRCRLANYLCEVLEVAAIDIETGLQTTPKVVKGTGEDMLRDGIDTGPLLKGLALEGAMVAERLAYAPLTMAIRVQSSAGSLRISACGNRAGRCRWPAVFSEISRFPPPFHSGVAPFSSQSPSSALKTSLLRTALRVCSEESGAGRPRLELEEQVKVVILPPAGHSPANMAEEHGFRLRVRLCDIHFSKSFLNMLAIPLFQRLARYPDTVTAETLASCGRGGVFNGCFTCWLSAYITRTVHVTGQICITAVCLPTMHISCIHAHMALSGSDSQEVLDRPTWAVIVSCEIWSWNRRCVRWWQMDVLGVVVVVIVVLAWEGCIYCGVETICPQVKVDILSASMFGNKVVDVPIANFLPTNSDSLVRSGELV
ncbi:hypothetical protein PR048_009213 [Dryococelus australis]|uniref:Uncharacterized protein n=1 Tax=Dryococelus australis TaxID=614101 RepID=A0ABQ9HZ93_9NEOP|nr:hypothetical protein PR048_009213 [Dryococelus australis]